MRVGIPREIKNHEYRVGLAPAGVHELVAHGHEVLVETGAGFGIGADDAAYVAAGATIAATAQEVFESAELIVKVKEPQAQERAWLRAGQMLFTYLHLAPDPQQARDLLASRVTAIAYETVTGPGGTLPLLAPMSIIAGRIATQVGTHLLHQPAGGKGKLLGGLPSTERGKVVVLGAGAAGGNSAALAAAGGANVIVFDKRQDRLAEMMAMGPNVTALYPYEEYVAREVTDADLIIGAVLIPSARAPRVVTAEMVRSMEPGTVMVDISVDQGGCFETTRPTTWANPTYVEHGVTHFAVTNMPGAVPKTSSEAICAAILPYVQNLAAGDVWREGTSLARGINVEAGKLVHPALQGML